MFVRLSIRIMEEGDFHRNNFLEILYFGIFNKINIFLLKTGKYNGHFP
jgi:hypothetical protein